MTPEEVAQHRRDLERKRAARYRASHREQRLAYNKAYRATHRDEAKAYRASLDAEAVRAYMKAYHVANVERAKARKKAWHLAHRDEMLERFRSRYASHKSEWQEYARQHRHQISERQAAHKRSKRSHYTALQVKREAVKRRAVPLWANLEAIEAVYKEAARLTRDTGVKHDVDHIYPLQSPKVCGLHVEHNLQILTHLENMRKHNKLPCEMVA